MNLYSHNLNLTPLPPSSPLPPSPLQKRTKFPAKRNLVRASRHDADDVSLLDRHYAPKYLRRAKAYEAMGKLERAQEVAMQALCLQPQNEEVFQKVQSLTRDIGLTDFGVGPSPEQLAREGAGAVVGWTEEEQPTQWYRKETVEMMEKSLPYTVLHALELAVHAHVSPEAVLKKKTRLCIHLAGASSELEGLSDFCVLFDKLPHLEELEVVQVGWVGLVGPCKRFVPDPQAPPAGMLVGETRCLGHGRRLRVRRWKGLYHDFLAMASRHEFDCRGYLHEAPDVVLLANPSLDFFFDCWAPTLACLRDAGYLTVLTGGNLDHSRKHHNLILQAMGVKVALHLRTSRFGIVHGQRACKNHNLCAFSGAAPLVPGRERQPSTAEECGEVRVLLQRLGLEMETEGRAMMRLALLNQKAAAGNVAQMALASSKRMTPSFCDEPAAAGGGGVAAAAPVAAAAAPVAAAAAAGVGGRNNLELEKKNSSISNSIMYRGKNKELTLLNDGEETQGTGDEAANNRPNTPRQTTPTAAAAVAAAAGGNRENRKEGVTTQSPGHGWSCRSFRKGQNGIYVVEDA